MMETSGWSVVEMPLKVVWSFVTVVCGAQSVAICGGHQMLELPVINLDSLAKVISYNPQQGLAEYLSVS
jgi:hypothetical protein